MRCARGSLPKVLPALALLSIACGARTTLDLNEFGAGVSGGTAGVSSGGNSAHGGLPSASGGSGSGAAPGGGFSSGATSGGGTYSGSGGPSVGGAGPDPGDGMKGGLKRACRDLCQSYVPLCPSDYQSNADCTLECLMQFHGFGDACRQTAVAALNCMATYYSAAMSCDAGNVDAYDACFDLLNQLNECSGGGSDECSGGGYVNETECDYSQTCMDSNFDVHCYAVDDQSSTCVCTSSQTEPQKFQVSFSIGQACDVAQTTCGF